MDNVVIGNLCQDPVLRQPQQGCPAAGPVHARGQQVAQGRRRLRAARARLPPRRLLRVARRERVQQPAQGHGGDGGRRVGRRQLLRRARASAGCTRPWRPRRSALPCAGPRRRVQKVDRRTDGDTTADPEPSRPRGTDALPVPIRAVPLPVSLHPAPPVPPPDVAAVTSQGEHESITSADGPAAPATIAPVAIAPVAIDPAATESAGRRRGGMHRRKQPEPDSAVARAG